MKITIPNTLKEIKLKDYQNYQSELDLLIAKNASEDEYMISKISTLCNLSIKTVKNIQSVDIWKISRMLDKVLSIEPELVEKTNINGLNFGWLPNLDKMSYGEFLDLNDNISNWQTMHIAMAVLYRPIVEEDSKGRYNVENYQGDKYHEYLKDITLEAVISAMVFFWHLGMDCVIAITKSLDDKEMKFQKQLTSVEIGVGLQQSLNSLVEMLQKLNR